MSASIDLHEARRLVRSRRDLLRTGHSERDIEHGVRSRSLIRLRRDRYITHSEWQGLWPEGRHLVRVIAADENCDGAVFSGPSAAVLHGLPLYRHSPAQVHGVILGRRHGRSRADIAWHNIPVPASDIVEIGGIRCTSIERTVLDVCRMLPAETALPAADAALRRVAVTGQEQDADAAAAWHERMTSRAARVHGRGIRPARELLDLADGRAQLPGESVSRLYLHRLGYRDVGLQTPVTGPSGEQYWLDFAFRRSRVFGEFDGMGKYLDEQMRGEHSAAHVVLREKEREDAIRGVTGWRLVRWRSEDIRDLDAFARRLHAFGIRPPG